MSWINDQINSDNQQKKRETILQDSLMYTWDSLLQKLQQDMDEINSKYKSEFGTIEFDSAPSAQSHDGNPRRIITKNQTLPADYLEITLDYHRRNILYQWKRVEIANGNALMKKRGKFTLAVNDSDEVILVHDDIQMDITKASEILLRNILTS